MMTETLFAPDMDNSVQPMPSKEDFLKFTLQYQQMIVLYESAIKCVTLRLEIMESENEANGNHTFIRSISSRIKEPMSINRKLQKLHQPISTDAIQYSLHDVAGVRVVCGYLSDVYAVKEALLRDNHMQLLQEKDYIKNPKPNGYRSLHLILNVPVPLQSGVQHVKCELQIRTTAMDTWAALEHQLRYKKELPSSERLNRELLDCANLLAQTDEKMQSIADELLLSAE